MQPFICGEGNKVLALAGYEAMENGGGGGGAHVDFRRLGEGPDGVDVVVEDDDPDHHSQAERHRLLAGEAAAVFPGGTRSGVRNAAEGRRERPAAILTASPA